MKETYIYRGQWQLPDQPQTTLSGTLTIERGRVMLDVDGNFGPEVLSRTATETTYSATPSPQDRIVGFGDGQAITLVDCHVTSSRVSFPGIGATVYIARVALIGVHLDPSETVEFNEFDIRTSDLEHWVGLTPFPIEPGRPNSNDPLLTIRVPRLENREFPLGDGLTGHIKFSFNAVGSSPELKLAYSAWIGLRFPEPRDLEQVARAVGQLRNFLSLAIGKPPTVLAIDVYHDDVVSPTGERMPIKLFYEVPHNPEPSGRPVLPAEMLFTLEQAGDRFPQVLRSWIHHHDVLSPVVALYFGTLYHPSLYVEQRFLGYAQALETYDRLCRPTAKERSKAAHKRLVAEIVGAAPQGERQWLKRKLAFSNELALADRLREVLALCPDVSARTVGDSSLERFVRAVKDSRNYYTHYDPRLKTKAATGGDLHLLAIQLRTIVETALLMELGFPRTDIEPLLQRTGRFSEIDNFRSQLS